MIPWDTGQGACLFLPARPPQRLVELAGSPCGEPGQPCAVTRAEGSPFQRVGREVAYIGGGFRGGAVAVDAGAVMGVRVVTVNDVLDGHAALDIQCLDLDRIYLNAYVMKLQTSAQGGGVPVGASGLPVPLPGVVQPDR